MAAMLVGVLHVALPQPGLAVLAIGAGVLVVGTLVGAAGH